jgi:hypothetical protein
MFEIYENSCPLKFRHYRISTVCSILTPHNGGNRRMLQTGLEGILAIKLSLLGHLFPSLLFSSTDIKQSSIHRDQITVSCIRNNNCFVPGPQALEFLKKCDVTIVAKQNILQHLELLFCIIINVINHHNCEKNTHFKNHWINQCIKIHYFSNNILLYAPHSG